MGLTTPPRKEVPVRKPEMWPRRFEEGPLWWRRPALGCSANEEEEGEI